MTTKITEQNVSNLANLGVQWQSVHVADGSTALTVSPGKGYFIDTTSATQSVNLPANASSTAGDTIVLKDYARKWGTNAVSIASNTFDGVTNTPSFSTTGQTVTFVHQGTTKGWSLLNDDTVTGLGAEYVTATGGTVATSGNYKIHSFTGDGNFVVSSAGNATGSNKVSYLVVAGGGGGGGDRSGGGGGGGFREGRVATPDFTASPLVAPDGLPVSAQTYPVTVGGGGSAGSAGPGTAARGTNGSNSVFSTITSAGGGFGSTGCAAGSPSTRNAGPGGSGGGGGSGNDAGGTGGAGNTPPVSPAQGSAGGAGEGPSCAGAGGGGATAAGQDGGQGGGNNVGGNGGAGASSEISGSAVTRSGGGGGGAGGTGGNAGTGGAGAGVTGSSAGNAGTANTGGGGSGTGPGGVGGAGGKGIVIIRYKFQN